MDIVYILGDRNFDSFFIDHSVALVKKNLKGFNNIFIIGKNPHIKETVNYPMFDINVKNVEANMVRKILHACKQPAISNPFILMNDDMFILKPVDVKDIGISYKNDLVIEETETVYGKRCLNTAAELQKAGLTTLNYECHRPTEINKQDYIEAMSKVDWDNEGEGILCTSFYGNMFKLGKEIDVLNDAKSALELAEKIVDDTEFKQKLSELDVISTEDNPSERTRKYLMHSILRLK